MASGGASLSWPRSKARKWTHSSIILKMVKFMCRRPCIIQDFIALLVASSFDVGPAGQWWCKAAVSSANLNISLV
jgi:hypothetical protein